MTAWVKRDVPEHVQQPADADERRKARGTDPRNQPIPRGARRLRVGDYRVIYRIEPPDVVLVVKIGEPSSHSTAATSERLGRPWECRHQKSS